MGQWVNNLEQDKSRAKAHEEFQLLDPNPSDLTMIR